MSDDQLQGFSSVVTNTIQMSRKRLESEVSLNRIVELKHVFAWDEIVPTREYGIFGGRHSLEKEWSLKVKRLEGLVKLQEEEIKILKERNNVLEKERIQLLEGGNANNLATLLSDTKAKKKKK